MGSWAGLGGGAHRPSGWLDIARWSRRIDLHHRVRLVWGIAPMDGGRGRRGEGWRGGQARSCPSHWGWCWRGGAAPSGLLGRASASEPRRSEFPYAPGRAVRAVGAAALLRGARLRSVALLGLLSGTHAANAATLLWLQYCGTILSHTYTTRSHRLIL